MAFFAFAVYNLKLYPQKSESEAIFMELRIIEEDMLRIMLTELDMIKYDIDCDSLDYKNTKTRKAVWGILDEAYRKTGFDAAKERVCIKIYPDKSGGCKIYITKLHDKLPPEDEMNYSTVKERPLQETGAKKAAVYGFADLDSLINVCRRLGRSSYDGESGAYIGCEKDKKRFYLVIYEDPAQIRGRQSRPSRESLFICEYGTKISAPDALSYIKEHGCAICEGNAVSKLAAL